MTEDEVTGCTTNDLLIRRNPNACGSDTYFRVRHFKQLPLSQAHRAGIENNIL